MDDKLCECNEHRSNEVAEVSVHALKETQGRRTFVACKQGKMDDKLCECNEHRSNEVTEVSVHALKETQGRRTFAACKQGNANLHKKEKGMLKKKIY